MPSGGSRKPVVCEDESQQPWEHSPTHPHPAHVLSTNATQCLACCDTTCNYSSSVRCKASGFGIAHDSCSSSGNLGSQLMPLTVESVYKYVYFGISLGLKTCELAYPRFATNPVYVVCLYACVLCVLSARVLCMCGYLTLWFNEAAAIHSPWTDVADSQGRILRTDCYSHTNLGSQ